MAKNQILGLAFLPNPHIQIMRLYAAKTSSTGDPGLKAKAAGLQAATYNAFIERGQEIDCTDIKAELRRQQRAANLAKRETEDDEDEDEVPPKPSTSAKAKTARPMEPRPRRRA